MNNLRETALNGATFLVAACVVTLTVTVVRREFFASQPVSESQQDIVRVDNWNELVGSGHRIGPADAPLAIVMFSDFQCPACAFFASQSLPRLRAAYPGKVALIYRHWPLNQHPFAYGAARAAECAAQQSRFSEYHDMLFAQQKEIGTKTFSAFAKEAGVPDLDRFTSCAADTAPVAAIDQDVAVVRALGGTGTPTLIVNGLLLRRGGLAAIDSVAAATLGVNGSARPQSRR